MDKKKIENPKVFISYAWGTEEYQEKVLQFATRLYQESGIDIVIDKWSMDAGNDTFAFMEKSVNDSSINFVLLLLDKVYAEKADDRKGGVGTETQIISPKVYAEAEQTKFVPIIFERGANGEVFKPTFLSSRLHFDLTQDNAESEYRRLLRHLYGEKTYPMPKTKGTKPVWIDKPETIAIDFYSPLNKLDNEKNPKERRKIAIAVLGDLTEKIMALNVPYAYNGTEQDLKAYLDALDTTKPYRDTYLELAEKIVGDDFFEDIFADFAEKYREATRSINNEPKEAVIGFLLHEISIYTIALLWKYIEYDKIKSILNRTYFTVDYGTGRQATRSFSAVFYYPDSSQRISSAKKKIDNKNYLDGAAQIFIERINSKFTQLQLVSADTLMFNFDIMFSENTDWWRWFPMLYIYGSPYTSTGNEFLRLAKGLMSRNELKRYKMLFGTDDIAAVKKLLEKLQAFKQAEMTGRRYGHAGSFSSPALLIDSIKIEEVGTLP